MDPLIERLDRIHAGIGEIGARISDDEREVVRLWARLEGLQHEQSRAREQRRELRAALADLGHQVAIIQQTGDAAQIAAVELTCRQESAALSARIARIERPWWIRLWCWLASPRSRP